MRAMTPAGVQSGLTARVLPARFVDPAGVKEIQHVLVAEFEVGVDDLDRLAGMRQAQRPSPDPRGPLSLGRSSGCAFPFSGLGDL
jgi:hypothetical protein